MPTMRNASLDQMMEAARDLDQGKIDVNYKLTDISDFDPLNYTARLGSEHYTFDDFALKQFLQKLKIPYNYFVQCSPDLRDKEIREGIRDNASDKVDYVFKTKESSIYGIVPKVYCPLRTSTILDKITSNIPDSLVLRDFSMDLHQVAVRFIANNERFIENDTLQTMADVAFSEVGATQFQITSAIFRQVCTNGMMLPEGAAPSFKMPFSRYKEDTLTAAISTIPDRMFSSMAPFMNTLDGLKRIELPLANQTTDNPPELIKAMDIILPSRLLQKDYGQLIYDQYTIDKNFTVNGLTNAVTRTARDIQGQDKTKLEMSAGSFLAKIVKEQLNAAKKHRAFDLTLPNIIEVFED